MRGRKPKPTVLHALQNTTNVTRHRARTREPKLDGALPKAPPAWMTESQKAGWRHALKHAPRGLLKPIDRGVLAVWVEAEDRHRTAAVQQAKLDADNDQPLLIRGAEGLAYVSPYLGILTKAALLMIKAASELGFSPASRPRISVPDEPSQDSPWSALQVSETARGGLRGITGGRSG